jgi:FKBP12-rapamycin complex-associated protein
MSAQAMVVSHELLRVAILWHEQWHEGLEEASRFYFTEKNPEGMIAVLEPLHDMLEAVRMCGPAASSFVLKIQQGPTTQRETSFAQVFGRDLHEARDACRRFRVYGEVHELDRAWDIYYGVCDHTCWVYSAYAISPGLQEDREAVATVDQS